MFVSAFFCEGKLGKMQFLDPSHVPWGGHSEKSEGCRREECVSLDSKILDIACLHKLITCLSRYRAACKVHSRLNMFLLCSFMCIYTASICILCCTLTIWCLKLPPIRATGQHKLIPLVGPVHMQFFQYLLVSYNLKGGSKHTVGVLEHKCTVPNKLKGWRTSLPNYESKEKKRVLRPGTGFQSVFLVFFISGCVFLFSLFSWLFDFPCGPILDLFFCCLVF